MLDQSNKAPQVSRSNHTKAPVTAWPPTGEMTRDRAPATGSSLFEWCIRLFNSHDDWTVLINLQRQLPANPTAGNKYSCTQIHINVWLWLRAFGLTPVNPLQREDTATTTRGGGAALLRAACAVGGQRIAAREPGRVPRAARWFVGKRARHCAAWAPPVATHRRSSVPTGGGLVGQLWPHLE